MMQSVPRLRLSQQRELLVPTACIAGAFILGLIAGASVLHALSPAQLDELRQYLDSFLNNVGALAQNGQFPALKAWREILKGQLYSLGILWLLGLTVVGAPLVILLVGARGFILGFTVGFLVQDKAGQGLLLALVAVLPQNLFYVPGLLGAGTLALYFTMSLFKSSRETPVFTRILFYTLLYAALTLLVLAGTWIEAYLVPGIMRLAMLL
ncbi:MAG: stage II sporulation protein M [Thermacetogeniaceae bacterium]|jgi:stage II sporulation protein M